MSAALRVFNPDDSAEPTIEASAPTGSPPPNAAAGITVRRVFEWFEELNLHESSIPKVLKERRRLWSLFCAHPVKLVDDGGDRTLPIGDLLLSECKRSHLMGFLNKHAKQLSAHTRRRWSSTIQVAFNALANLDEIAANPFRGLRLPKGREGRDWTEAEYQAILRSTRNAAYRRFIVFIRFSGMRPGEIAELKKSHLGREGDFWKITLKGVEGANKTEKKTGKARVIPVNAIMLKLILWQVAHNPPGVEHIFLNYFGAKWKTRALNKNLDTIRQKAGLPKDVKCHGGRHTFITQAQLRGVDISFVKEFAGHESIVTTQRYTHLDGKVSHLAGKMEEAGKPAPYKRRMEPGPAIRHDPAMPLFDDLE